VAARTMESPGRESWRQALGGTRRNGFKSSGCCGWTHSTSCAPGRSPQFCNVARYSTLKGRPGRRVPERAGGSASRFFRGTGAEMAARVAVSRCSGCAAGAPRDRQARDHAARAQLKDHDEADELEARYVSREHSIDLSPEAERMRRYETRCMRYVDMFLSDLMDRIANGTADVAGGTITTNLGCQRCRTG